jgi:hypothetical protein
MTMAADVVEAMGRRIVAALGRLPHIRAGQRDGEVVNTRTGERVMPCDDDDGFDYAVVTIVSPDGSATAMPGHHYLDRQLVVAAREELGKADEREVARRAAEMLEHFRRDYSI